jgi:hypothetical protein
MLEKYVLWDFVFGILDSHKRKGCVPEMYEVEFVRGHVEVFRNGVFCFSADTRSEAEAEIALLTA